MSIENRLWGAPRIHGELLKLGFEVAQSSVAKYMVKRRGPPSQSWKTFLQNHAPDIAAMDLFVVPTLGFSLLYAFVIVRLDRRNLVRVNVTTNPTVDWIARQLTEAFPWDEAPRYLIRDRDRIYGTVVTRRMRAMGIRDKPTAPASSWQNGYAERLIGSIRRECVDHLMVLGEAHLRRILEIYARYYNDIRTHRSLNKDAPISRSVLGCASVTARLPIRLRLDRFERASAFWGFNCLARTLRYVLPCIAEVIGGRGPGAGGAGAGRAIVVALQSDAEAFVHGRLRRLWPGQCWRSNHGQGGGEGAGDRRGSADAFCIHQSDPFRA